MKLTTASMDLKVDQVRTKKVKLNKFTVQGGIFLYKLITVGYKYNFDCYNILSLSFLIPLLWRVSYIIWLPLNHLDPTLVNQLSFHLSACPTRHFLWFAVSCGSQGNTVQGSPQHKYS